MLNIESKRAAEPKHRQQTRIERDVTDHCPSCTSSCNPSARHPRLEFGRNGQDANRATLSCAQRLPALLRALHMAHSSSLPLARPVGTLDTLNTRPRRNWTASPSSRSPSFRGSKHTRCHQPRGRPLDGWPGRTSIPSSLAIPTILGDAQTTRLSACYADACLPTSLVLDRPPPSSSNGDPGAETAPVAELSVSSTSGV